MTPGELYAARFEIVEAIGVGGMGEVFRAVDRASGAHVALKRVARRELGRSTNELDLAARFEREASILAELRHPHVVGYVAHGVTEAGELYLAMEWLEGEDLAARLARGPLPLEETLALGVAIAEAAGAAHARGIVHRDIKPANVFLCAGSTSRPKLIDFGLARALEQEHQTRVGLTLGTPAYMSPEQARGGRDVDARADVFSIGCVLFECLTGQPPLVAQSALALLAKILLETPPRAREINPLVPAAIDDIVAATLAKEPERRPADGNALAARLRAHQHAEDTIALPTQAMAARSTSPPGSGPALTADEQRILAVVLGTPPSAAEETEETTTTYLDAETTTRLEAEVAALGGRFERLRDGSVMVTVLSDRGVTAQAAQVVQCALALRTAAPWLDVSVATGRGTLAGGLPTGEVIERAARRLIAARTSGRIALDDVTASLLEGRFTTEPDGDGATLVASSIPAVPLVGRRRPRCVGRDGIIRRLSAALDACVHDRLATAVLISGDAGIGKTRVLSEALERASASLQGAERWTARGNPMAAGSPYGLVVELLRSWIDGGGPSREADLAGTLRSKIGELFQGSDRERIAEFLTGLVGEVAAQPSLAMRAARRDHMLMGDQLRKAISDLCVRVASERPLVIVLEDLQWGDIPSIRCVEDALARAKERPLFVVGLARPELQEALLGGLRERVTLDLTLTPLSKRAATELVREELGDESPSEVVERIVERGQQNPFFLEELVRAAKAGRADGVPETVLAVTQARLERLSPDQRRILRAASVFGRRFPIAGLEVLLGGAPAGPVLEEDLRSMMADDLVAVAELSARGIAQLAFVHDLVREAAYRMLTDDDRTLGHSLAARWLVEAGEGEPLALAEHLERCGEQARAVAWYREAAEQALGGSDLAAVLSRVERGLACGAAGEDHGVLCLVGAEAHNWLGHTADALALARTAVASLPASSRLHWRAMGEVASCLGKMGAYDELESLAEVFESDIAAGSAGSAVIAAVRVLVNLLQAGRIEPAERLLTRATALFEATGDGEPASLGWLFRARASYALRRGDPDAYRRYNEQAAASFEAIGDVRNAAMPRVNVGYGHSLLGAYEEAVATLQDALEVARGMGLTSIESFARVNLQLPLARAGRLDESRAVGAETVALGRAQNNPRVEGFASIYRALAELEAGHAETAIEHARAAIVAAERIDPVRLYARGALIQSLLAVGAVEEAVEEARNAEEELRRMGSIDTGDALVRLACIEAWSAAGEPEAARQRAVVACDRLIDSAARIADASSRDRFLKAVPEHARTLALAHELSRRSDP